MADQQHQQEQQTRQAIKVRQVTEARPNWSEQQRGEHGRFTLQIILDDGAEEYVLHPPNRDIRVLIALFEATENVYFDTERLVLSFRELT